MLFRFKYCIIALMKIFKYKFTKLTFALICAGIALCFITIGINIYSVATSDISEAAKIVYPIIQYTLLFLIPAVMLVLLISLLLSSHYSLDENTLKTSFGIIKSKYNIKDIQTILLDRTTDKLFVYFKGNSFLVIVVKDELYEDFIDTLCKLNGQIEYTIRSKTESDKDDTQH